jgi:hypothetical protein
MRRTTTSLWRNPDFLKLWADESVSLFGSRVTTLALPLTAILTLRHPGPGWHCGGGWARSLASPHAVRRRLGGSPAAPAAEAAASLSANVGA